MSQDFMHVFGEGDYSLTIYTINRQPVLNWLSGGKGKRKHSRKKDYQKLAYGCFIYFMSKYYLDIKKELNLAICEDET